jgi:hypothetical protein
VVSGRGRDCRRPDCRRRADLLHELEAGQEVERVQELLGLRRTLEALLARYAALSPPQVPDYDPRDGYRWAAVASKDSWRVCDVEKECSAKNCRAVGVAELNRGQYRKSGRCAAWWAYCPEHLAGYGRWVMGGAVVSWLQAKTGL